MTSKQETLFLYFNQILLYVTDCVNKLLSSGIKEQLSCDKFLQNQLNYCVCNKQRDEEEFNNYLNDSNFLLASIAHDIFSKPHDGVSSERQKCI